MTTEELLKEIRFRQMLTAEQIVIQNLKSKGLLLDENIESYDEGIKKEQAKVVDLVINQNNQQQ